MPAPEPTRYLVCDGTRVIELETVPTGGYRFDPPPDDELDGRCERIEHAFWSFREEPPPPSSPLLRELAAAHATAAENDVLDPGTATFIVRRGGDTLALHDGPGWDGGDYHVVDCDDPRLFTQARSLSECFEMIEDVRELRLDDEAVLAELAAGRLEAAA